MSAESKQQMVPKAALDAVYDERDKLVYLLVCLASRQGWRVGVADAHDAATCEPEWRKVVYIDLPTGQVSWHVHESKMRWYCVAPEYPDPWDRHTTEEKYARLMRAGGIYGE